MSLVTISGLFGCTESLSKFPGNSEEVNVKPLAAVFAALIEVLRIANSLFFDFCFGVSVSKAKSSALSEPVASPKPLVVVLDIKGLSLFVVLQKVRSAYTC